MSGNSGIEIIVLDCTPEALMDWLLRVAGPLGTAAEAGDWLIYSTRLGQIIVTPNVGRQGGTGVWFNADELPWPSHVACARMAAHDLGCVVLCDPGAEYANVDPHAPVFLEVTPEGERLVIPDDDSLPSDTPRS